MPDLYFIPKSEFDRIAASIPNKHSRLLVVADMCRLNTLVEVKKAGSGHLGSSFSAMDLNVWLYFEELNVRHVGTDHPNRDIFFSSKGHDVPGLYSVFHALGILPEDSILKLRRLGGLDGHPDVNITGCEANTGSLGMGISKGRGMAWAKRHFGRGGRVFVMTGDGELQEGQIWESLQTTAHQKVGVTVIVDYNKLQTDMPVAEIISLGDIESKFRAFGWHVERCDGHDFVQIEAAFRRIATLPPDRPKVLIADTVKGRGVRFMEQISSQAAACGKYVWHSGAPADEPFQKGFDELLSRINSHLSSAGLPALKMIPIPVESAPKATVTRQYIAAAYGEELVRLASDYPEIIVLDGDLSADCKVREFASKFPDRFIENGIAEQDMVSLAGGLARQGMLPVCNSFSSFLCARANEQIYNNACEGTKIIYAAHFAGMIPAGPGKSHQSVRDIGLMGSLPNLVIAQPCNLEEARWLTRWAVCDSDMNVCLRMNIGPSPRDIISPENYRLEVGKGFIARNGSDAVIFAYGAVMLNEALNSAEILEASKFSLKVVNQPWLNRFDFKWLKSIVNECKTIYTLDDHILDGGFGERLIGFLAENGLLDGKSVHRFGLTTFPMCGTPLEVLKHHGVDGSSLAQRILTIEGRNQPLQPNEFPVFNTLEAAQ
jgi:transketolase